MWEWLLLAWTVSAGVLGLLCGHADGLLRLRLQLAFWVAVVVGVLIFIRASVAYIP